MRRRRISGARRSRANECARGAFPERGLGRAKALPDVCRAERDSGVTPERRQVRFGTAKAVSVFPQYTNLVSSVRAST